MEILGSQGRLWGIAVAGYTFPKSRRDAGRCPLFPTYSAHMGGRLRWSETAGFRQSRGVSFTHPLGSHPFSWKLHGFLLLPEVHPLSAVADTGLFCGRPGAAWLPK